TSRAVHRLVVAGLERHLGFLTAARASHAEHFARTTAAAAAAVGPSAVAVVRRTATIALGFAGCATVRTTTGFAEPSAGVEILLAAGERECLAAIAASKSGISRHRGRLPSK